MAYLHCHTKNCGWSQDDFWDENYNPVNFSQDSDLFKNLMSDKLYFLDENSLKEMGIKYYKDEGNKIYFYGGDYVIWKLQRRINRISRMIVKTYKEFLERKDTLKCPRCGLQNFDID